MRILVVLCGKHSILSDLKIQTVVIWSKSFEKKYDRKSETK